MAAIRRGQRYRGKIAYTLLGVRGEREVTFVAARDQDPEPFIRGRVSTPDQDRVFIFQRGAMAPLFTVPALFIADSIEAVTS
jgi:hypothetical protein